MAEFLLYALLAGLGVALITGPLGAFVVWRRMAYFGDTLAHSALLGVALSLWLAITPGVAITIVCLLIAIGLFALQHQHTLAADTLLGILSHSSLALGLIAIYLIPGARLNLEGILFGDLLTVSAEDTMAIWLVAIAVLVLLIWLWRPLLAITVHQDLAQVEGTPVAAVKAALMLALALVIAIAMKVVGVLLITALLVIPAATARRFAKSPEAMAIFGSILGCLAVICGLAASWFADTPVGPSIVLCAGLFFVLVQMLGINRI
ncbi:MAG: metal ABC transporter permease [Porticoccaceae bacterium]|nr:metal ABC transporter permease [Porticoccaceae bacterium]